jgi:CBS domain containing-hemolysin-like protein
MAQVEEIKLKRHSDPDRFTVLQLAKEYNTFPGFIMRHTQCPPERKEKLLKEAEYSFEKLSLSKKKVIIDRLRRKALW